jgi:class 3 adenylate cyclase/CheY-like chemotaxis protein
VSAGSDRDEVAALLRHELGTQVNHIVGYGELLLEEMAEAGGPGAPNPQLAPLEEIRDAGREVMAAVHELLHPAHVEAHGLDLAALAAAVGPPLERVAGRVATLTATGAANPIDLARIDTAARRALELARDATAASPDTDEPEVADVDDAADAAPGVVLVVDDDAGNRDLLVRWLARLGYRTLEAGDGQAALDALATHAVDVMLLDLRMPGLDGFGVLERCRADPALDVPTLMISASGETESAVRAIEMGAEDYLSKPFDRVLLKARVGACLEKKRLRDREHRLLATVSEQADRLSELNRTLEARVQSQVEDLERLARLRRFLSPQVAELVVSSGEEGFLQSHRRDIAVLFSDLRGFTAFAETSDPEDVMAVLAEFHDTLGALVHRFEATVGFFSGDGVMVFFNDPVPCADAAERAIRLAVVMRQQMVGLTSEWARRGHDLHFGVGIATGYATLGVIGFEGRHDYGVIGSAVNLAARLCAEAQPGQILVSKRAYQAAGEAVEAEEVGKLELKGFHAPVPAYNVTAIRDPDPEG